MRRAGEPREAREVGKGKRGRGNRYGALQGAREPETAFAAKQARTRDRVIWAPKR